MGQSQIAVGSAHVHFVLQILGQGQILVVVSHCLPEVADAIVRITCKGGVFVRVARETGTGPSYPKSDRPWPRLQHRIVLATASGTVRSRGWLRQIPLLSSSNWPDSVGRMPLPRCLSIPWQFLGKQVISSGVSVLVLWDCYPSGLDNATTPCRGPPTLGTPPRGSHGCWPLNSCRAPPAKSSILV